MAKRPTKPPEWFRLEDYAPARTFDERAWADMLGLRLDYREFFKNGTTPLDQADSEFPSLVRESYYNSIFQTAEGRQTYWNRYLEEVLPSRYSPQVEADLKTRLELRRASPAIQDITIRFARTKRGILSHIKSEVQLWGNHVLLVNPDSSDTALRACFEEWLENLRKERPFVAGRRGPKARNAEITEAHITSWITYQVLAVLDLDFYAEVHRLQPLSHEALAATINPTLPGKANYKEWGRSAREKAQDALLYVDALIVQAKGGTK